MIRPEVVLAVVDFSRAWGAWPDGVYWLGTPTAPTDLEWLEAWAYDDPLYEGTLWSRP
jgi:hypothetical protein